MFLQGRDHGLFLRGRTREDEIHVMREDERIVLTMEEKIHDFTSEGGVIFFQRRTLLQGMKRESFLQGRM